MRPSEIDRTERETDLMELKLLLPAHLHRAFQRCLWIRINETGRTPVELMEEMVTTYLKQHGC